jgi:glycosyltransferase involved in cell wall biosynthesis
VSVVIPTRDRHARLEQALRSVAAQTYPHLDVIVVDDASAQPVEERACVAGCGSRVRVKRLDNSVGAAGARNRGLAMAEGELVAFLDDDDRWAPTKVERQVHYLQSHPEVGIVSCDHLVAKDDPLSNPVRFRGARHLNSDHLKWANFGGSFSFVMARRSVLGDALWIDESFSTAEDWDLWLRCAQRAPVGVVPEALATYVFHRDSRLTDTLTTGLTMFAAKHREVMSRACIGFHEAHRQMDARSGSSRRFDVARALISAPPETTPVLLVEQAARQVGRVRRDPGLAARVLTRWIDRASRR